MYKQEIKIELTINGQKVKVGHRFLEDISRCIPEVKENKKVFSILATSNNYEIRKYIANKKFLSTDTIEILLNDENENVVETILINRDINKFITDEQIDLVIEKNNIKLLCSIASNIDEFQAVDKCRIIKLLTKHENSRVRHSFFTYRVSELIPNDILKELSKDSDFDVTNEAKKELENRMN